MEFLLLLLFLSVFSNSSVNASASLVSDAAALISLKQSFQSSHAVLQSWEESNPTTVCSWLGVKCDNDHVVSVDVSGLNISSSSDGVIVLSGLEFLANVTLANNELQCEIKVSNLPQLRYLNLSGNQLGGGLDFDYATISNLEVFDAYNNNFTAELPLGVTSLKQIRYLDLGGNFLYGNIPVSYGEMTTLEYLSLNGNDLKGRIPAKLGNLTNLKQLYLGYFNMFDGGIPQELGKLSSLTHLDISSCGLGGVIPESLGSLASLDTLFLHTNLLSGQIPPALGNLTNLVSLDLSNNALTGEIPVELDGLKKLRLFNLFMNRLHGSIPAFVAELPELETLELFTNNFTGKIPEKLGSSGSIKILDLSSNKLTGNIPDKLCFKSQLKMLILFKNFLFGSVPESLGKCSSLVRVRLGENYLNGSIPTDFLYLPNINLVELQNNYITGTFPENNSSKSSLSQLNMSNNMLSGQLPDSISDFSSLQALLLSNNKISGGVPANIGKLQHLSKLDVSGNNLSGFIPEEIGNCTQLTYLDLSNNQLSGPIPQKIAGITILNYLNLSRNRLNDSIPNSMAGMKSITSADFSFNDLSGKLPDSGQLSYLNASAFAGNPLLCGAAVNNPCSYYNASIITAHAHGGAPRDFKLIFALALLVCSLVFAVAAAIRTRSQMFHNQPGKWRLTAFQKVEFTATDVLECMKECNVIGRGGAGVVYRGTTPSGQEIAAKRLQLSRDHDGGFAAEVKTLGNIRHRNIVRLLAFCSNAETNILVYEFMGNGSLGEVLHGKGGKFLSWDRRYRIAVEAARGLCYLHHDCCPKIVHRDVKSNNILLDYDFEAHVADFGLAKFLYGGAGSGPAASEYMSAIAGSYGYIAPEYAYTLKVDEKSDVYSYGVVLLELITGRKPVGEFGDGVDIVQWTKTSTEGKKENVLRIVDSRLSTLPLEEAMHLFFVAMLCVQENSVERPTMREVVQMLSEFRRHVSDQPSPSSSSSSSKQKKITDEYSDYKDSGNCFYLRSVSYVI